MRLEKVLCPTDFSETSLSALETAVVITEKFDAQLHLLYVLEDIPKAPILSFEHLPTATPEEFFVQSEKLARKRIAQLAEERIPEATRGTTTVRRGLPFLEILLGAKEQEIDLIVMSTHGHTGLRHALLGSVTEKVVRKALCPVLTVRARSDGVSNPGRR